MKMHIVYLGALLMLCSCAESESGTDLRLNEYAEGWYFLVYNRKEYPSLPVTRGRQQIDYPKGKHVILTSSEPDFGWTKLHCFLIGKKVSSSDLGGVYPSQYTEIKSSGEIVLSYQKFYIGDIGKIDEFGDPDEVLVDLLGRIGS